MGSTEGGHQPQQSRRKITRARGEPRSIKGSTELEQISEATVRNSAGFLPHKYRIQPEIRLTASVNLNSSYATRALIRA